MENHTITDLMGVSMSSIKEMVDVNTVVGDPITTPDGVTIIPVSKVSLGFVTGGSDLPIKERGGFGGGNGAGIKIDPIGFLVIKDDSVRMLNIAPPARTTVDRLVEMLPDVIEKVEDFMEKRKG